MIDPYSIRLRRRLDDEASNSSSQVVSAMTVSVSSEAKANCRLAGAVKKRIRDPL
jgi:hypothetical protein